MRRFYEFNSFCVTVMHRLKLLLDSCDFIGDRYSYTRVDVNIVLTADFSWSYTAFVGWVGSTCTLPWVELGWVCSSVGWVK